MRICIGRKGHWLGIAVVAIAACVVTGAFAVSSGGTITTISGTGPISFTSIAAGEGSTCALTRTGGVMCWGDNKYGQLGDGTKGNRYRPTGVLGLSSGVKQITVGARHACALLNTGAVKCWGNSTSGQVGNGKARSGLGATIVTPAPDDVVGLSGGVKAISAGDYHTCALMTTGRVKCWGQKQGHGQGIHPSADTGIPVESGLGGGIIAISSGLGTYSGGSTYSGNDEHTCAITTGGGVKCWYNFDEPAVALPGFSSGIKAISTADSLCLLTTAGKVRCTTVYQSGAGTPVSDEAGLESGVTDLSAFGGLNCALTSVGAVKCWGAFPAYHTYGVTPVGVPRLGGGVKAVAVGNLHACAIRTTGGIKCWGFNYYGQLGTGKRTTTAPFFFESPVDVVVGAGTTGGRATGSQGASVAGPSTCSPATAKQVAKSLLRDWVDPVLHTVPINLVLCGHFVGPGSNAMVASLAPPTGCGGSIGWAVFNYSAGRWRVVLKSVNGAFVSAVGSDIRATVGNPRPGDSRCSPSAWKSQVWHWNGKSFVASPWAPSPPPKIRP